MIYFMVNDQIVTNDKILITCSNQQMTLQSKNTFNLICLMCIFADCIKILLKIDSKSNDIFFLFSSTSA